MKLNPSVSGAPSSEPSGQLSSAPSLKLNPFVSSALHGAGAGAGAGKDTVNSAGKVNGMIAVAVTSVAAVIFFSNV